MQAAAFSTIPLNGIVPETPLPCDLYVVVNHRHVPLRRRGEKMTKERIDELRAKGVRLLFTPSDQYALYSGALKQVLKDPGTSTDSKCRALKASAEQQMKALFDSPDLPQAISDTRVFAEGMVDFVSKNIAAAQTLMALSMSDRFTFNHSINVSVYAIVLARTLYPSDRVLVSAAGLAGMLHDIGKRNVEPDLLNKATSYSMQDVIRLREHPLTGEKMLQSYATVPTEVKLAVAQHHEHFDGTGYPKSLSGGQMHKLSRLLAIADVFDALTIDRQGQLGLKPQEAIESMAAMDGRFDPAMFQSLVNKKSMSTPRKLAHDFDACTPQPLKFT